MCRSSSMSSSSTPMRPWRAAAAQMARGWTGRWCRRSARRRWSGPARPVARCVEPAWRCLSCSRDRPMPTGNGERQVGDPAPLRPARRPVTRLTRTIPRQGASAHAVFPLPDSRRHQPRRRDAPRAPCVSGPAPSASGWVGPQPAPRRAGRRLCGRAGASAAGPAPSRGRAGVGQDRGREIPRAWSVSAAPTTVASIGSTSRHRRTAAAISAFGTRIDSVQCGTHRPGR